MAESEEEFVWCSLPGVLVDQHLFSLSQKVSYGVVCLAYLLISTCFRCPKRFCLIGCAILPIAQSIEATIVDWDGYIYIYTYIHTYIHTYKRIARPRSAITRLA